MKPQPKLLGLKSLSSLPIDSLAALVSSIICISLTPIFIRISEQEIGPNATVFNRFWIAAVAFGLVSALLTARSRQNHTQSTQHKPEQVGTLRTTSLLIADGVLLSTGMIFWAWSLTKTSIADSSIMHNLVPIFTVLGGWLALGQTFDRRFVLGMFVALTGSLLLEVNDLLSLSISQQLLGNLAALLSAVFFGIHPLIIEKLRINLNSVTILTWSSITSALLLLPVALIAEGQIFPSSLTGWFSVIALAFFGQILGVGLWAYCLKKLSAGFGSLVALVIPALSAVEGWAIFSEHIELWTLVSFLVILFGMYLALFSRSAIKSGVESSS
ncbi:DMT family transporter [Moorena producens]|uniref:DMT family transporter n=1 Tax=Moorena producens TaxID=1155739 RepID=UPI003C735DB8